jgi:hypothetical protein
MNDVRELRFWSSLLVLACCGLAIAWALPTLRFALAAQFADGRDARTKVRPFFTAPPVAALAQQRALVASADEPAPRADALQALLGARPLAGGAWLDLAIARQGAGRSLSEVASALAMSSLTGPHEGRFMWGRAAFGLPLWEQLPPDMRRGLVADLLGGWSEVPFTEQQQLADVLALSPDRSRAEIVAALRLAGASAAPVMAMLELAPDQDGGAAGVDAPEAGDPASGGAVEPPVQGSKQQRAERGR